MKRQIVLAVSVVAIALMAVGCKDGSEMSIPDSAPGGGKVPIGSIASMSSILDSFEIVHNELCKEVLDSIVSRYIVLGSPVNSSWDDSVRSVVRNRIIIDYGTDPDTLGPHIVNTSLGDETFASYGDTCTGFGTKARWVLRRLDTILTQYTNSSISLSAFDVECIKLRDTCLTLLDTFQIVTAGAMVMTTKGSAHFWSANKAVFVSYMQQGWIKGGHNRDGFVQMSETDRKILAADGYTAGAGVAQTLKKNAKRLGRGLAGAYFSACVGSIYKGVMIGFGMEGGWLDTIGGWLI